MTPLEKINSINIRPGVSVLAVLRHLNYRPWFAIAEFVDNAIDSYLKNVQRLRDVDGEDYALRVYVDIQSQDEGLISIRDNAAGIASSEYRRAFRPAEIPPDTSGLSEFGMGMKSAACWFAPRWRVRSTALGEATERTVTFDIERIVTDTMEELDVTEVEVDPYRHYTEIVLSSVFKPPQKRTLGKIREHLTDIYRTFTRGGSLELHLNGEPLIYQEPSILSAPYYKNEGGDAIQWRNDIEFDLGQGLRASGFVAIREKASVSHAGFALFRKGRLIQGSGDEGYRPEYIFGKSNSFPYQRVFGELHLEGFDVSHTKDGFRWDENEQPFLELLREQLTDPSFPLLEQARQYRVQRSRTEIQNGATSAVQKTSTAVQVHAPGVLGEIVGRVDESESDQSLEPSTTLSERTVDVSFHGRKWSVTIVLSDDQSISDWLEISSIESPATGVSSREVVLRLSMAHPFMERYSGVDVEEIEPLLRVAVAIALAEVSSRESGIKLAGTFRRNINELLRGALSRP